MNKKNRKFSALDEQLSRLSMTDSGNAERFIVRYGVHFRYDHTAKKWRIYEGGICPIDEKNTVKEAMKQTAERIWNEAGTVENAVDKASMTKWWKASLNDKGLNSALSAAQSLSAFATLATDYDSNLSLLCVENGVLDLDARELLPHDPKYLLTKKVNASYDPEAKCPEFDKFLNRVQPDENQRSFLQRAMGYSIAGTPTEQVFFFLYGGGANGKSVFMEVFMALFRSYAGSLSPETVLGGNRRQKEGATPELARLVGTRLAQVPDLPQDQTLDEVFMKTLTGGDTITARGLYASPFDFKPVCVLWIRGNHKPRIL